MAESKKRTLDNFGDDLGEIVKPKDPYHVDIDDTLDELLIDEFAEYGNDSNIVDVFDEVTTPELTALDQVAPIEEFEPGYVPKQAEQAAIEPTFVVDDQQIAKLEAQIAELKKALELKATKNDLASGLESVRQANSQTDSYKRSVNAVSKPTLAYIANGVAITALLVGAGLGLSAQSQLAEFQKTIAPQLTALPASDAANQALKTQLDELAANQLNTANQIAELNKANEGVVKSDEEITKQIAKLNSQNKQLNDELDNLQSKLNSIEKIKATPVVTAPPAVSKVDTKKPEPVASTNWSVTLMGSKHDWYALRKADEYASKGFPAKIVKGQNKGESWYRLSVDGFNSQHDADAYAAKVRKSLNLDSVTVSHD
ncbi:MAG: SPOR domain-containing protein [Methylomonas sp.]